MRIGVVASASEQNKVVYKWYEFWKRQPEFEVYVDEDAGLEYHVMFAPEKIEKWIHRAEEYFNGLGIEKIIYTESINEKIGFISIGEYNGKRLMHRLSARIIEKAAKNKGVKMQDCTVAYIDSVFEITPDIALRNICKYCRYLQIVSERTLFAKAQAQALYDEYGIAVEVVGGDIKRLDCDFVVYMGGDIPRTSDETIIIDISDGLKKRTIKSIKVSLYEHYTKVLPYSINKTSLAECLWLSGVLSENYVSSLKINEIVY